MRATGRSRGVRGPAVTSRRRAADRAPSCGVPRRTASATDDARSSTTRSRSATRVRVLDANRIVVGADTLTRSRRPTAASCPSRTRSRRAASREFASLIGEYGWDHDVLYIREKDGKLNALIEWFFEYPLERVSTRRLSVPGIRTVRRAGDRLPPRRRRQGDARDRRAPCRSSGERFRRTTTR